MNQAQKTCAALLLALGGVSTQAQYQLEPLWSIAPGQRSYITSGDAQRSIAYNPVTDSVLIVNRSGGLSVNRVSASTGANLGTLNVTGISGGTFALNMISVADDGAIYAANQVNDSASSPFRIYRWANESATPELVYSGDPSGGDTLAINRNYGNTLDVRGSGESTQILISSRSGTAIAILSPNGNTTGNLFDATKLATDITAGDLGLSVSFGEGDIFFGTASGRPVRVLGFNTTDGVANTLRNFGSAVIPTSVSVIGLDSTGGLMGGINMNSSPTRDAAVLYQVFGGMDPVFQDSESLTVDNPNSNATGATAFGTNQVFVLDSNNGLYAYTIAVPEPSTYALGIFGLGALAVAARRRKG